MSNIKLASNITLECVDENILNQCISDNTFDNPLFLSNELNNRSNWNTERTITTYHQEEKTIILPRGYMRELIKNFNKHNITYQIIDDRVSQPCLFPDKLIGIDLRHYQQRAVDAAMKFDQGAIISPTGSGKSLTGLEIARRHGQKTLVILHRNELAGQWCKVIEDRLGLKPGRIGDGHWEIGDQITIAMVQTLSAKKQETKSISEMFGLILNDELHHICATTFFDVIRLFPAKFRYGLSATLERRDGLEPMIYHAVGPAIATISREEVEGLGATVPIKVISVKTGFKPIMINSWNDYLDSITINSERNIGIINLAQKSKTNGAVLILVDRVGHAQQISDMLQRRNIDHVLAHGQLAKNDREGIIERIKSSNITIGTTGLLGEGLDVSVWSTLILASPISSEIKLLQAVGRIVRPSKWKEKALVIDLKDDCAFAGASFNKRLAIYKKHGIYVDFKNVDKALRSAEGL